MHSLAFSYLAVAVGAEPSMSAALNYLLAGFGIVMLTLLCLSLVCAFAGLVFRKFPALAALGMAPEEENLPKPSAGADAATMAAIGAAVDQAFGGRYRVSSVQPLSK